MFFAKIYFTVRLGERSMELKTFFLQQLERETVANRKVLERVPQGKNSWKPHDRSMEMD